MSDHNAGALLIEANHGQGGRNYGVGDRCNVSCGHNLSPSAVGHDPVKRGKVSIQIRNSKPLCPVVPVIRALKDHFRAVCTRRE